MNIKEQKFLEEIPQNLIDEKFGRFVKLCIDAMRMLKEYSYYVKSSKDNGVYERNLIISLAYMMGKYDHCRPTSYLINGEINKAVFSENFYQDNNDEATKSFNGTHDDLSFKTDYVIPDFLIHKYKSFNEINKGGQFLIAEVKSKNELSNLEFYKDFFKLNIYIDRLKFENAVYIIVNQKRDDIERLINNYIAKDYYLSPQTNGNLLFIIQENEDSAPITYKFDNPT